MGANAVRKLFDGLYLGAVGAVSRYWLDIPAVVQRAALIFMTLLVFDLVVTRWYAGLFGRVHTDKIDVIKGCQARVVTNLILILAGCALDLITVCHGWVLGMALAWAYEDHAGWLLGQVVRIRQHYRLGVPLVIQQIANALCPELHILRRHRARPGAHPTTHGPSSEGCAA